MRRFILWLLLGGLLGLPLFAQEAAPPSPWQGSVSLGQYPARLLAPNFSPLHPGIRLGLTRQWNSNPRHQLIQSGNLAYFYHADLQHAVQVYTELGYRWQLDRGLQFTPLVVGGGYVLSILDMTSLSLGEGGNYHVQPVHVRSNWLVSLGATLGYQTGLKLGQRPITLELAYRLQVQGTLVRETVPVIAYTPIMIGLSLPIW